MLGAKQTALQGRPGATQHAQRAARVVPRASATGAATKLAASDYMQLGKSGLVVPVMGVGAWSWGDRTGYWGYGKEYGKEESRRAYKELISSGLTFIDTAEVYGFGKSEEFLGEFIKEVKASDPSSPDAIVATKFAPQFWRYSADSVVLACKASLQRMQLQQMSLYMQHWPGFGPNYFSNDTYLEGFARCYEQGLTKAVGVSNFSAERVRNASKVLGARGLPLASNQVQYSLLYRTPERNGVLEACKENGTTLVAYSPLCQGLLTGKYRADGVKPTGPRAAIYNEGRLRQIEPLLATLKAVADERGKTMAQVSLNWCICKGTLPIPGAKNEKQLAETAGALGWRLSEGEVAELDRATDKIPPVMGFPVESW